MENMAEIMDNVLKNMTDKELSKATLEKLQLLNGKKYCISDLEHIVKHTPIKLIYILKTQHLTAEFCRNYILNEKYIIHEVDDLTEEEVVSYQPHIKIEDLLVD